MFSPGKSTTCLFSKTFQYNHFVHCPSYHRTSEKVLLGHFYLTILIFLSVALLTCKNELNQVSEIHKESNQHTNILTNSNIIVWRQCIAYQQNEETRRHCNANWKPTRENKAQLQIMTYLWGHHWRNHSHYDVIRLTTSSTNSYLYHFIIKCNLVNNIQQRRKNTKNMKLVQNHKLSKIFRCFQENSHCQTSKRCRALKNSQNMSSRCKLKVTKRQPTPVYTFWNFPKKF